MTMPYSVDNAGLLLALIAGLGLGFFYYGGLWWTVRQLPTAQRPEWLFLVSFTGRTLVTVGGLYLITGADWGKLLVSMVGFWLARGVLTRRLAPHNRGGHHAVDAG